MKTVIDGIEFDSQKEAGRYTRLKLLEAAGLIKELQLQVPFELNEGGSYSLKYVCDFVYIDTITGQKIYEDTKGYRTKEYLKKKRLMKKIYGITITET